LCFRIFAPSFSFGAPISLGWIFFISPLTKKTTRLPWFSHLPQVTKSAAEESEFQLLQFGFKTIFFSIWIGLIYWADLNEEMTNRSKDSTINIHT
jgi:hypothetical protein